jgi:transcriptional regulator with XRE-family HTH domain
MKRASAKIDHEGDLKRLGAVIRAKRKAMGMSQEELADHAQLDRSHMGRIERGERNVSVINLMWIARAMSSTLAEIISDAGL